MHKILIVDDDPTLVDFLKMLLESEGYETEEASDGHTALQKMTTFRPELILLDYMMPKEIDGLEVLRRVQKENPDIPVVMLTGKGNEQIAVECMKAGAADYLVKPFENDRLLAILRDIFLRKADRRV